MKMIHKWSWGAFFFTFVWGLWHRVWISLLWFVPILGPVIMPFILGAKGYQWALAKTQHQNSEKFNQEQRKWNIAAAFGGLFFSVIVSFFVLVYMVLFLSYTANTVDVNFGSTKNKIMDYVNKQPEAVRLLGAPIEKYSFISSKHELLEGPNYAWAGDDFVKKTFTFQVKGSTSKADVILSWEQYGWESSEGKKKIVQLDITPENSDKISVIEAGRPKDDQ